MEEMKTIVGDGGIPESLTFSAPAFSLTQLQQETEQTRRCKIAVSLPFSFCPSNKYMLLQLSVSR